MSDRFDFLEIGDARPATPPPSATDLEVGPGWKPLRLRAVEEIGGPGTQAGMFSAPTGIAVDRNGVLYVADSNNHRVQRITPSGDVWIFGRPGNGPGQLWGPQAVAVDPSAQFLYVAEQGNNRVQCLRVTNGQHVGMMDSGMRAPSGVAFDAEGKLWVADTGNSRLLRIDLRQGQFIGGLDRACGVMRPISVACDSLHNVYVTDGVTEDVTRYTYFGVRAHALGEIRKLAAPQQVAVDGQGRVYLAESGADRLHVFDAVGQSLVTFDTPSTKLGSFRSPAGVALGPNGEIYVADTLNHRIIRLAWD